MRRDPRKRNATRIQMSIKMCYRAAVPLTHSQPSTRPMSCVSRQALDESRRVVVTRRQLGVAHRLMIFNPPSFSPRVLAPDANRASHRAPCKPQKESELPLHASEPQRIWLNSQDIRRPKRLCTCFHLPRRFLASQQCVRDSGSADSLPDSSSMLLLLSKTCAILILTCFPTSQVWLRTVSTKTIVAGAASRGLLPVIDLSIYIFKVKSLLNVYISSLCTRLVFSLQFSSFLALLLS